ncbi:MAG TPA: hypothetical protein VKK31_17655 [Thermoanaerobaculia bacterium]|nr:hypothetical protein [Thermoanaerobaculia bacterium]
MRALLYRSGLALLAACLLAEPAAAQEIGKAVRVIPQVRAFPSSGGPDYDLQEKGPIELGLKVRLTGKSSYLRVALRLNGQSTERSLRAGQKFSFTSTALLSGPSEVQFGDREEGDRDEPGGSKIRLMIGKLWLALVPGEPPVDVVTPDVVASIKGTYLRILVDPAIGTFIAVDEGVVTVQAKAGGAPVDVAAGQQVLVPSGGLPQPPATLGPGGTVKGLGSGEPFLDPPALQGGDNSTEPPTGGRGGPP